MNTTASEIAAAAEKAIRMALQHIRICAPDPTVEAALESIVLPATPPAGARDAVTEIIAQMRRSFQPTVHDFASALEAALTGKADGGEPSTCAAYTMCAHCNSVQGGHTLACQAIYADGGAPAQIPIPEDSPWLKRRRAEEAQATQPSATGAGESTGETK